MTEAQIATNHRALIAAAARLEKAGYQGDAYRFVEGLVVNVLADGYRPVEPPPVPRGPGSTPTARRAAKEAAAAAIRDARAKRQETKP